MEPKTRPRNLGPLKGHAENRLMLNRYTVPNATKLSHFSMKIISKLQG